MRRLALVFGLALTTAAASGRGAGDRHRPDGGESASQRCSRNPASRSASAPSRTN